MPRLIDVIDMPRNIFIQDFCCLVWRARRSVIIVIYIVISLLSPASTQAEEKISATVQAKAEQKFGRLVFEFSQMPRYEHSISGSILILKFDGSVSVDLDKISIQIPNYVSVARLDPDGRTIRFALTRAYRINLMEAGNMLFLDVLPPDWVGLPPSLPKKVIADLARRVAEIEAKAREEARQRKLATDAHKLSISIGKHATFSRIVFDWNKFVTANLSRDGKAVSVKFGKNVPVDVTMLKVEPLPYLQGVMVAREEDNMEFILTVNPEATVRGFREGFSYIVDLEGPAEDVKLSAERFAEIAKKMAQAKPGKKEKTGTHPGRSQEIFAGSTQKDHTRPDVKSSPENSLSTKAAEFNPQSYSPDAYADWETSVDPVNAESAGKRPVQHQSQLKAENKKDVSSRSAGTKEQNQTHRDLTKKENGKKNVKALIDVIPPGSAKRPEDLSGPIKVAVAEKGGGFEISFPFREPVAAAAFRREKTIWLVFDSIVSIDESDILKRAGKIVAGVQHRRLDGFQYLRLKLTKPWLIYASAKEDGWVFSVGDLVSGKSEPLHLVRGLRSDKRSAITIDYKQPGRVHWLKDPNIGDRLAVVTAFGPARSTAKAQRFVDFQALTTAHGIAIKPYADDLAIRLRLDDVFITRSDGLILSPGIAHNYETGRKALDQQQKTRLGFIDFKGSLKNGWERLTRRASELERAIAVSDPKEKNARRLELARLYMSYELSPEALGILKQITKDDPGAVADPALNILRGVANVLMGRTREAQKDLRVHALSQDDDAALWRGLAKTQEKDWAGALNDFRAGSYVIDSYPYNLQASFRLAAAEAALETNDLNRAADELDAVPGVHLPDTHSARLDFLRGRYLDQIGRVEEALETYQRVADSEVRPIVANARLRKVKLSLRNKRIEYGDAVRELESLAVTWRGDETELATLHILAQLYVKNENYRQAFEIMKNAVLAFPKNRLASQIQDEMKEVFADIFLHGKAEKISPVAALSLYYDYRELTPVGRLGDEMIRRLADKLITVDLLDQAAELLDHQVKNRLKGAARAQVATRLAMVHLMNRKPELALRAIRLTRQPGLPIDLLRSRDILEARALGELGRVEGAIDILSRHRGQDVDHLKADAYWNAQKWLSAGEQLERNFGARWQQPEELTDEERFDVLRAAISYSMADDHFGLDRLRKKFYPMMVKTRDAEAFVTVTQSIQTNDTTFRTLVKEIAAVDTLSKFMKQFRKDLDEQKKSLAPFIDPDNAVSGAVDTSG